MMTKIEKQESLLSLTNEQLKLELKNAIELSVFHLRKMATIWEELENRGEDLSDLRQGLLAYLPLIARNKLDPEIIIKFAGQKTLMTALSRLPIEKQKQLIHDGYVTIVSIEDATDKKIEIQKPMGDLSTSEIHLAFSETDTRSADSQYKLLINLQQQKRKSPSIRKARRIKIDKENGIFLIGTQIADIDRIVQQLSEFYEIDVKSLIEEKIKERDVK